METQWIEKGAEIVLISAFEDTKIHFTRPGFARCVCGVFLPRPHIHCVATIVSFSELQTPTGINRVNAKWFCLDCLTQLFKALRNGKKET